jgi:glycosyltransferase involved in cell wall biosynthesis
MKLLWVKTDFLHPTTRGGQIRTLEMLKRLHRRHQVHYIAFEDPSQPEGSARAPEYSMAHYCVPHRVPEKNSLAFAGQLVEGLWSELPVAVLRYCSGLMRRRIEQLQAKENFDAIVCDFLFPAPNIPDLGSCVLFQHNVEALIWQRHVEHARTPLHRWYFRRQAQRMAAYEGAVCRQARRVVAVSKNDARMIEQNYQVANVGEVPTGVDVDYFAPPPSAEPRSDLIFLGSMDWMPNIDGALWFCRQILPLIRRKRPECTLALVGRKPTSQITALTASDPRLIVTGTVDDVRPWLHGARVSIVPLRIGGGTRLKIFEAMAAGVPAVSTAVGAEGLDLRDGETLRLAETPEQFAQACLDLLEDENARGRMAAAGLQLVTGLYSWEAAAAAFERWL